MLQLDISRHIDDIKEQHKKYMVAGESSTLPETRDILNRELAKVVRLSPTAKILYPCIGLGNLLPEIYTITNEITGVEANENVANACNFVNYWRSDLNVINDDYTKWKAPEKYDLVLINPPFDNG